MSHDRVFFRRTPGRLAVLALSLAAAVAHGEARGEARASGGVPGARGVGGAAPEAPSPGGAREPGLAGPGTDPDWEAVGRESVDLLRRYVRIDTTNPPADVRAAAAFLQEILSGDGIEVRRFESAPGRVILLARLAASRPAGAAPGAAGPPGRPKPVLLLHHMDVVPVDTARWTRDPFGGDLADGYVHGRGAMDMKGLGVIHLQTLRLLKRSRAPRDRDVLLMATPDEETGGLGGARWMIERHWGELDPEYVLDEGGFGARDVLAAGGRLVYAVSVAEKRVLWVRLAAGGTAAHGSQPVADNAVERLSGALGRILAWRDARPAPPLPEALRLLRDAIGAFADNKFTRAIRADTISPTTLRAGVGDPLKVNVIPSRAEATLDCRLLPGTDPEAFLGEIRRLAGPDVKVETIYLSEEAPPSPTDTRLFRAVRAAVGREAPDAVVAPFLIPYGTDSNAFRARGAAAYGFLPAEVDASIVASMHGDAERFPAGGLERGVRLLYEILSDLLAP